MKSFARILVMDTLIRKTCIVPERKQYKHPSRQEDVLRHIVIDGSNVAMNHGNGKCFSAKGIKICVEFFRQRGHKVMVFVPQYRSYRPSKHKPIEDQYILNELREDGCLVYTPCRSIGAQLITTYDDRFVLNLAQSEDAVVVSNDRYRDLVMEKASWKKIIEERLLFFSFVGDIFMPSVDRLRRYGLSLDEFLKKPRQTRILLGDPNRGSNQLSRRSSYNNPVAKQLHYLPRQENLRCIVVDGSNVAMTHGNHKFVSRIGIGLCVRFFQKRGHKVVVCVPPSFHPFEECLIQLKKDGCLLYRQIGGSYNRFVLDLTEHEEGILVSNNQFKSLKFKKASWMKIIEERLLMYCFAGDLFMPPDDPLGRNGPSLDEFLRNQDRQEDRYVTSSGYKINSPRQPYFFSFNGNYSSEGRNAAYTQIMNYDSRFVKTGTLPYANS